MYLRDWIPWRDLKMNSTKRREYRRHKRHEKQQWKQQTFKELEEIKEDPQNQNKISTPISAE